MQISRLELEKPIQGKTKHTSFEMCPVLRDLVDEVRTAIENYDGYVYIPDFIEK